MTSGFSAQFFDGPMDGERKSIERRPDGSPPPEIMVSDEKPEPYTEIDEATPFGPDVKTGLYVCTGRRGSGATLEAHYEWRGWQVIGSPPAPISEGSERWTYDQAGEHCGDVSAGTYRSYVARQGAPAADRYDPDTGRKTIDAEAVRQWQANRTGQGARTDLRDVGAGVELSGWGRYGSYRNLADDVTAFLGELESDHDVPALAHAYRAAINAALDDTGITLAETDFYGTHPVPDDWDDLIREAVASVDLGELAPNHQRP